MSIKRTMNLLMFVVFPAGVFLFGYLGAVVHWVLALLAFPWAYLVVFLQKSIRCPRCGVSVGRRKHRILDVEWDAGPVFAPRRCEHCGYDLTGREGGGG
jgi:hypothetical protein